MARRKADLKREVAQTPRPDLVRELAPEGCFALTYRLAEGDAGTRPRAAVAVADVEGRPHLVATRAVVPNLPWVSLLLPEGAYRVYLLEDRDGDGFWTEGEVVAESAPVSVAASATVDGFVIDGGSLAAQPSVPRTLPVPLRAAAVNTGALASSLDDPIFDPERGERGLYDPAGFLAEIQTSFFGLEPIDPSKTIVVFVHGASGTPRDFKSLAAALDRTRFQPWFFYYPSGMPLDKLGAGLATSLATAAAKHGSELRVVLVAHSMGGLVARSALGRLCENGRPAWLRSYVSFAAAYGGNDAAATGVKRAPVVVPSWRDLATGSEFLTNVLAKPLPKDLPFLLFFGWGLPGKEGPDGAGDGVIALKSQLEPRAQEEAWRMHGFPESHVGILENPESVRLFREWLDR